MKPILTASAAVLSLGAILSSPASAQTSPPTTTQQQAGPQTLPQGSYSSSCKDARMLGGELVAFCDQGNGNWHTTTLSQADQCTGDVQNLNGTLTCAAGPQVGSSSVPQNYNSALGTSGRESPARPSVNTGNMNQSSATTPSTGYYGNANAGAAPTYTTPPAPGTAAPSQRNY
ncbi:MAG TPA: hypothetical protein VGF07_05860 [Stellaceae bacterium]